MAETPKQNNDETQLTPDTVRSEMRMLLQEYKSMENVRDIIKKGFDDKKITSGDAKILMRSVRMFEGNAIDPNKKNLEFKTDKELHDTINENHLKMIRLAGMLNKFDPEKAQGEGYLKDWNRVYEAYIGTVRLQIEQLKKEIEASKKDTRTKKKKEGDDILKML